MGLDGPAHLAEEIPEPKKSLPRVMLMVIISQFVVGLIWIIVLGFSITDLSAITNTATGYSIPPS
jgi:choline transport protein